MDSVVLVKILKKLDIELTRKDNDLVINDPHENMDDDLLVLIKSSKKSLLDYLKPHVVVNTKTVEEQDYYPLSHAQKRLWLIEEFGDTQGVYNISSVYDLLEIDQDVFRQALNELLQRHEALRTTFKVIFAEPRQIVHDDVEFQLDFTDLSYLESTKQAFLKIKYEEKYGGFDLIKGPLVRGHLVKLSDAAFKFIFTVHHIISDGWSMRNVETEFFQIYQALLQGESTGLDPLPFQYKDYSCLQITSLKSGRLAEAREYWLSKFKKEAPLLEMPTDFSRPAQKTYNGGEVGLDISQRISDQIREACLKSHTSMFMYLLALTKVLLYKYSNQGDIVVGVPSAGRDDYDLQNQVGFYVNTLAMRTEFDGNYSFAQLLEKLRFGTLDAYDNQNFPFDLLVDEVSTKRDPGRSPIFDVLAVIEESNEERVLKGDEDFIFSVLEARTSKFDLTFNYVVLKNVMEVSITYNSDLYKEESVTRMLAHFGNLLQAVLKNENAKLKDLNIVGEDEHKKLMSDFQGPAISYSKDSGIQDLFLNKAKEDPSSTALILESGEAFTYEELASRAVAIGSNIKERIGTGKRVGLLLDRNEGMVLSMIGTLISGNSYIPIDKAYPQARKDYILTDAQCDLVIVSGEEIFDATTTRLDVTELMCLADSDWSTAEIVHVSPSEAAYVIYTSGSTGKPKGVEISHGNVVSFLSWAAEEFGNSDYETVYGVTSYCFDLSVFELYHSLTSGKQVKLLSSGLSIEASLQSEPSRILLNTVPSVVSHLLRGEVDLSAVSVLNMAGEPIPSYVYDNLPYDQMEVRNLYGPSETTTYSTVHQIYGPEKQKVIGKPIGNTEIYVLDDKQDLVPTGVWGEICISGAGLSIGYLGKPDLTAQKYITHPFKPGERLYRTGDVGRWKDNGDLEFSGRADFQVKIRGFRIELGEIEQALSKHDLIEQAVIAAQEFENETHLVCYYIGKEVKDLNSLKDFLKEKVPAYMVPSYFMYMSAFPLNNNGKIDRSKLPEVGLVSDDTNYAPPKTDLQKQLVIIWKEVLGIKKLGINDNFFEVGGHSLKATRIVLKIYEVLGIQIKIRMLFDFPTVAGFSQELEKLVSDNTADINDLTAIEEQSHYPVSYAQKRLWVLDQFADNHSVYNVPDAYELNGYIDYDKLNHSLLRLIDEYEILRTSIVIIDGEPRQRILDMEDVEFELDYIDFKDAESSEEIDAIVTETAEGAFELSSAPLLRAKLLRKSDDQYLFLITLHHIICDEWSIELLYSRLMEIYAEEEATPNTLQLQYKDYSVWQNSMLSDGVDNGKLFWLHRLSGDIPVLNLPIDNQRPPNKTYNGATQNLFLGKEVTNNIKTVSQEHSCSAFIALQAALKVLLFKYSGQKDIIIGTPVTGRDHADLANQIGFYVNTLALRSEIDEKNSFNELVEQIKKETLEVFDNQQYPFDLLIEDLNLERDMSRSPLFDVVISVKDFGQSEEVEEASPDMSDEDLAIRNIETKETTAKYELSFTFLLTGDDIGLSINYNTDLFNHATIKTMLQRFRLLLENSFNQPDSQIRNFDILTEADHKAIELYNSATADYPTDITITELFNNLAEEVPDKASIVCDTRVLKYKELNEQANKVAHALIAKGIGQGDIVGVMLPRNEKVFVSYLGILKSGAAFMPIDMEFPPERVEYLIKDSALKLIIVPDYSRSLPVEVDTLSINDELLENQATTNPNIDYDAEAPMYVIYTSGSTGRPNGVAVCHKTAVNLCFWQRDLLGFGIDTKATAYASFNFDASIYEAWPPLVTGAELHVLNEEIRVSLEELSKYLKREKITHCFLPTVVIEEFVRYDLDKDLDGIILNTGGSTLKSTSRHQRLINNYGPTETTVAASFVETKYGEEITIGRPVTNTEILILDDNLRKRPPGLQGEICIAGNNLSMGYLNNPTLTAKKYVDHPYKPGEKLYRTGDQGILLPNNELRYIGRNDDQVKINGYRIELGEIEAALSNLPQVEDAFVLNKKDTEGADYLIGYYLGEKDSDKIFETLRSNLPSYMVPNHLLHLDSFPLTTSGKVDKHQLPEVGDLEVEDTYIPPKTSLEKEMKIIWENVLGKSPIGIDDNFFDLGGHSLKATRIALEVHQTLGLKVALRTIFETPTVRSLCALLTDQGTEFSNISPVEDQEHYPLSFAQRRLWITNELEQYQTAYNISQCFEINDHIYPDILRKAIYAVIEKHQVLRTAFISVDGNIRQKVIDIDQFRFDLVKESICDKEELKKIAEIELNTPFDLTEDTLFRCRLCEYSNGSSAFIFSIHHIISDGWSMKIFYKELMEFYRQISLGQADEIQGSLPIQYKDYAVWLQNLASDQSIQKQREFWHDQLSGQIPTLELPTDFTRPTKKTFKGKTEIVSFDHKLLSRLRAISQQFQCSMFITLHAAVKALLFKITGESDIIIGTPVAGRDHSSLSDQIGFYVNMIVLRSQFKGEESFAEFLNETKRDTLNAYDNQLYPFDLLVEELNVARDLSRSPLFEIMIAVDDMNDIQMGEEESLTTEIEDDSLLEVGDTETESKEEGAKYELSFNFLEREDGLDLCLNYNTDLYSDEKIKTYADCFNQIIYQIAADVDVALNDLELLSTREADRLDGYNNINPDLVDTENVVAMITKVAGLNPTHEALIGQGESLSYLELDNKSNQFANYLLEKNIGRGNLVGVLMNRSYESIISILGILKSGAAYVPIDPTYPVERQDYIINDSALSCLATNVVYKGNCNVDVINYSEINAQVELSMKVDLQDDDPAYVIYTSGTTGLAKGVVISHKSLMSYSHTFVSYFGLGVSDRIIHQANISFDISVEEIFPTLCTGAGLIIPNHQIVGTEDLLEIIDTEKVTLLSTTPMVVDELNRSTRNQVLSNLRYLISGGDYLKGENINNLVGLTAIYNTYGPTETTVCATYHPIEDIDECSIIGQSINNADIYVINDQNQIQPTGVIGEVCISGSGVALGYLNNPELTVNKFVDNPFAESGKMYKTGDLGYWLPNGKIKLVGRMDDQVKVRGYRVDPNEIESVIERHHHAEQSAVLPLLSNSKSYYLAAFYTGERNSEEEIREHLAMRLPSYMVPTVIRRLDELPKTSNGKIDQTALKVLSQHDYKVEEIKAPESTLETNLVNIWKECLEIDIIGTNQNFFEVGGNSLKALSIIKEYSQIDISMSLAEFFNNSTIRKQANFLTKSSEEAAGVIEFAEFNEDLRNLFLVPPILGSSTIYRSLALNLKQDYNCYGLQYFGFEEGQTPYQSIDEIVTAFRREIENVSKDNHITLVGYSFGAIVAFEVAKSLERKNINVTLVLIDKNVEHESIPFDELTDKDIDLLFNQQLGGWALTDSSEDLERLRTLFRQNLEIQAEYTNRGGIEGEMITIEATDGEFEAVMEEWQNHTSGKFHHHYLSGDHFTVLNEANSLNVKDIILEHSVNLHS